MRKSRKVLYTVINVTAFIGGCLVMGIALQNREQQKKKRTPSIREFFFCFISDNILLDRKESHYELKRTAGTS